MLEKVIIIDDSDFEQLCYSLSPNINRPITDILAVSDLLNEPGLKNSVFKGLEEFLNPVFNDNKSIQYKLPENQVGFLTTIIHKEMPRDQEHEKLLLVRTILDNRDKGIIPYPYYAFEVDQLISADVSIDEIAWDIYINKICDTGTQENKEQYKITRPKTIRIIPVTTIIEGEMIDD
jgi:hypothetical protein